MSSTLKKMVFLQQYEGLICQPCPIINTFLVLNTYCFLKSWLIWYFLVKILSVKHFINSRYNYDVQYCMRMNTYTVHNLCSHLPSFRESGTSSNLGTRMILTSLPWGNRETLWHKGRPVSGFSFVSLYTTVLRLF